MLKIAQYFYLRECKCISVKEWDSTLPGAVHHRYLNRCRGGRKCTPARHGRRKCPLLPARDWLMAEESRTHIQTHTDLLIHIDDSNQPIHNVISPVSHFRNCNMRGVIAKKLSQHFTHTHTIMTTDSYETFSKYCRKSNSVKLTFFLF